MNLNSSLRTIVIGIVCLTVAVLVIFALKRGGIAKPEISKVVTSNAEPADEQNQRRESPSPVSADPSPFVDQHYEAIKANRAEVLQRVAGTKIAFYGKVVDEQEQPIAGAKIRYCVHRLTFSGNPTVDGPTSNADGRFEIFETGPSITVSVHHPEYHVGPVAEVKVEYAPEGAMHFEPSAIPTKDSPTRFVLKKKTNAEALIHHSRIEARLPLDGSSVVIDLNRGHRGQPTPQSITVSLVSDGAQLGPNEFHPVNWRFEISVNGGGLVPRPSKLNFVAPERGYENRFVVDMPTSQVGTWTSKYQQDLFVRLSDDTYARIFVTLYGHKGLCIIESFLNPTPGSRNLEFDPAKQIKAK